VLRGPKAPIMIAPSKIPGYVTDTISGTGLLSQEQMAVMMCLMIYKNREAVQIETQPVPNKTTGS
jgi:hypothetical protein